MNYESLRLLVQALPEETVLRWAYTDAHGHLNRTEREALDAGVSTDEVARDIEHDRRGMVRQGRENILGTLRATATRIGWCP